jgi:hypothetical protein
MNVFEDLVVELQEENLLERTGPQPVRPHPPVIANDPEPEFGAVREFEIEDIAASGTEGSYTSSGPEQVVPVLAEPAARPMKRPRNGKEFYKKRAVGEVSNLQMVEHVLTGVEREYLKIKPTPFDDFNVKKSLNNFLQVVESENSSAHQEAEFTLIQETEAWCSALAERDTRVPVSALRQYCENSRPALSSQALLALARFYRNLPYSESVRSKFDFVITRLFSRPMENDRRACLFAREEALTHINTLYREWSSISLYDADDDDSKVMLTALSFDDLALEAEQTGQFDHLIESDFFGRLRLFKESISELFYAPNVTVAAIEANIRIGNSYVDLIRREREKMDAEAIHTKYGDLNDESVSDAAGRTLELVDLLRSASQTLEPEPVRRPEPEHRSDPEPEPPPAPVEEAKAQREYPPFIQRMIDNAKNINKWFLAFSMLLVAASVGIYFWANFVVLDEIPPSDVRTVDVQNLPVGEFVKAAKVSGDNLYFLLKPSWDGLPKEKRQQFLQSGYKMAVELKCKQVILTAKDGKSAGYMSATKSEIVMP